MSKPFLCFSCRKAKPDTPRSPTTPTSPTSPGGLLPPHLTTGDSVRDKCIEMLAAALRTDSEAAAEASERCRRHGNGLRPLLLCSCLRRRLQGIRNQLRRHGRGDRGLYPFAGEQNPQETTTQQTERMSNTLDGDTRRCVTKQHGGRGNVL